jgi:hypothetical protein
MRVAVQEALACAEAHMAAFERTPERVGLVAAAAAGKGYHLDSGGGFWRGRGYHLGMALRKIQGTPATCGHGVKRAMHR